MGGVISVESRVGEGTMFQVVLPVSTAHVEPEPAAAPVPASLRRGRIMVVDDDALVGSALRRMLAPDHDVIVTTSARDALTQVQGGARFDIIICDVMMPEMTGVELHAELMKTDPALADRIVFMTGGAFTAGTRDFLQQVRNPRVDKPIDWPALKALVYNLVK
jgi:CheY-like chemotaxis protein